MKREVRRIHWYIRQKKRKPTIPKLSRIKPTAFFIISLNNFERFVNNTISLDFQRP
jgi:hypothetical protein